jgi:eukaryotic-like serine/threonine-protein kinase
MVDQRFSAELADRYVIERELGAGGMATVYLAQDVKHGRKVALKVMHPELAVTVGAERFLQEIRTTANLQHPHILGLIDSGHLRVPAGDAGARGDWLYFVMPWVDGESLRDRLKRERQLPIETAMRVAGEVASALDFAHRRGVIHRDIKPENILLQDGQALVADFGIALAVEHAAGVRMTQTGSSVGTPQYMAPEQAMGEKVVDARTDVYALGVVLYEMLIGEPPFTGATVQSIVAKVLTERPTPPTTLRDTVSPTMEGAVLKALAKLPADRHESAAEFARALSEPASTAAVVTRPPRRSRVARAPWLASGALALALVFVAAWPTPPRSTGADVVRFSVGADASLNLRTATTHPFGISADGRTIVFRAESREDRASHLWIRTLDDPRPRLLEGTEGGQHPTISPDGRWLAFVVDNDVIRRMPLAGGSVTTVVPLDYVSASLTWLSGEEILFETLGPRGIQRVNAGGGTSRDAIPLDREGGEERQRRPYVVPGTDVVVFMSTHSSGRTTLHAASLGDGRRADLGLDGIHPLGVIDGRLIYTQLDGTMMTAPFDARRLRVTGPPVHLGERVASYAAGTAAALSTSGVLVYRSGAAATRVALAEPDGRLTVLTAAPRAFAAPRFSPDGRRIAVGIASGAGMDIWLIDSTSREMRRLTTLGNSSPAEWSPDGRSLIYAVQSSAEHSEVWQRALDGGTPPTRLLELDGTITDAVMTPDGGAVVIRRIDPATGIALELVTLDDEVRTPLVTAGSPNNPRISPDGRWLAYTTIRAVSEVFVRPLRGSGDVQVSLRGGFEPIWAPDSHRIFHRAFDDWTELTLDTAAAPNVIRRRVAREVPYHASLVRANYDVAPDGHTFVILVPEQPDDDVFIALNWADEVRRRLR